MPIFEIVSGEENCLNVLLLVTADLKADQEIKEWTINMILSFFFIPSVNSLLDAGTLTTGGHMECQHCFNNFSPGFHQNILLDQRVDDVKCLVLYQACPACKKYNIFGKFIPIISNRVSMASKSHLYEKDPQTEKDIFMMYPKQKEHKKLSDHIPESYKKEFEEAYALSAHSPKASAALARRLLQRLLEEHGGVKHNDLKNEIEQVLASNALPSYLKDEIDAIRNIGSFGAHPLDSKSTGLIVDVEPGEADWALSILEGLFEFYFVNPAKSKIRRETLNNKLRELGKPKMQ